MARLIAYGTGEIHAGSTAVLDGNCPVTIGEIRPPFEEGDPGRVTVTYEWGTSEDVDPVRLGAYIDED